MPLTKGFKGGFKDTPLDYIVYSLLKQVLEKSRVDPQVVEDICLGNVNNANAAYIVRAAGLASGFPNTAAASSVNRFCSSGLKAVQDVANQIVTGSIEVGIAIGAESMSEVGSPPSAFHEEILTNQEASDCLQPMGQTSENVGKDFDISREAQDRFAAESYQRAERAQKSGWFDDEIVPISTVVKDPKSGEATVVTLTRDEGPRYGTTFESLSKIRPAFPQFGDRSTGGNSSQVTDGGMHPTSYFFKEVNSHFLSSCRGSLDEKVKSHCSQSANPCQILRCHRNRACSANHGHRSYHCNP